MIYSLSNISRACRLDSSSGCKACRTIRSRSDRSEDKSLSTNIDDYRTLGLNSSADQESVRRAFIDCCKLYHPDSGSENANSAKFNEILRAYRNLQTKFMQERWGVSDENNNFEEKTELDREDFDIRHTAPQHRMYLSMDGIGTGTPMQRQNQYMQMKASKAAERVLEHRMRGLEQKGESLSVQERNFVSKTKSRFGMDRLVEDLIQESMCRGEFDNLPGAGKPLKYKPESQYVDFVTHKMNEIMLDNGFTPEWITMRKEIEEDVLSLKDKIKTFIKSSNNKREKLVSLEDATKSLNKKIQLYNLIVPIMKYQKFHFNLPREIEKIKIANPTLTSSQNNEVIKVNDSASLNKNSSILNFFGSIFR